MHCLKSAAVVLRRMRIGRIYSNITKYRYIRIWSPFEEMPSSKKRTKELKTAFQDLTP
jgi:hypothetical protein